MAANKKKQSPIKSRKSAAPKQRPRVEVKAKERARVNVKAKAKAKAKVPTKVKVNAKVNAKMNAKKAIRTRSAARGKSTGKSTGRARAVGTKHKAAAMSTARASSRVSLQAFMTPLDNRVVIQLDTTQQQKTAGGVWLSPSAEEKPHRGTVLAVGRGRRNKKGQVFPMDVAVGDEVLYGAFSGTTIDWQGAQILILREEEILGIVSAS